MLRVKLAQVWRRHLSTIRDSLAGRDGHQLQLDAAYRLVLGAGASDEIHIAPEQARAVSSAIKGYSVFLHLPTGAGKSLAFQVPALLAPPGTTTLVVSPLIALMHDQVANLKRKGIDAVHISAGSAQLGRKRKMQLADFLVDKKLVYTTPEFLVQNNEMLEWIASLRKRDGLSRIVLDEAHCVLEWGRSFRPSYLEFCRWKARHFRDTPVTLATATVHEDDISTLAEIFGLELIGPPEESSQIKTDPAALSSQMVLIQTINDRPNLRLEVVSKTNYTNAAASIHDRVGSYPAIVYCLTRREAEELCLKLIQHGTRAGVYHGGISMKRRQYVQRQWMSGHISLICATSAFGMGIDRADVRYVIHLSLPLSLSSYNQQIGRAGRDGEPATCVCFYSAEDKSRAHAIATERVDVEGTVWSNGASHADIEEVSSFCETAGCRRAHIAAYFGHNLREECSRNCNCGTLGEAESKHHAQGLVDHRNGELLHHSGPDSDDPEPSATTVEYYYQRVLAEARRMNLPKREGLSRRAIRGVLRSEPSTVNEMADIRGVGSEKAERFYHIFSVDFDQNSTEA